MSFTIGSLFDGSGGFPLAASLCGGTPKWASEIEPYPIAVTKSRFPNVKHLGSVTDIKGGEVEPVDVITFGSPCQDLSVAGKRAGLKHTDNGDDETTRSGLFMEAVRIIKEMRDATNGVYPRFAIYENVPGAFSSSGGEDFRIVLQELIQVVEPTAVMPPVPEKGWPYADSYCGDGWSIAYRVLDAQFWGVPQRRRRIYLVADFRGECAGKVSFEREGLRGYFETGRTPWQTVAGDAENCTGATDFERNGVISVDQGGGKSGANFHHDLSPTLTCTHGGEPAVCYGISSYHSNSMKSSNPHSGIYVADTARTLDAMNCGYPGCNQGGIAIVEPLCMATQQGGAEIMEDKCPTITAAAGMSGNNQPVVCYSDMILDDQGGQQISVRDDGKCPTLRAEMHGNVPCVMKEQHLFENHSQDSRYNGPLDVCPVLPAQLGTGGNNQPFVVEGEPVYCLQGNGIDRADTAGCNVKGVKEDICYTLNTIDRPAVAYSIGNGQVAQIGLSEKARTLDCMHDAQAVLHTYQSTDGALCARDYKGVGSQYVGEDKVVVEKQAIRYIVRRLTPTECARLQGFPDTWGHPNVKTELTDEEYQFWLNVRNTHAAINDKATKDYTKDQMLKWYNGLHTDSSEYKMWGNGIALPNALYVMQGIAEVIESGVI